MTGLCTGNSPVTGEFPAQMASNAENVSIWWRRHGDWHSSASRLQMNRFKTVRIFYIDYTNIGTRTIISSNIPCCVCMWNSSVTSEFPSQRPVTRSFDVFFDLCLNKRLSKQSWGWWFETPSYSLWRHCNEPINYVHGTGGNCMNCMWLLFSMS